VFGLSFGELCVLIIVAMVVLGPKELPRYLRKAGQFAGRLRRLANEMREKSGIDEVLRTEGIDRDIAEIRRLARGEIGGVVSALHSANDAMRVGDQNPNPYAASPGTEAQPEAPTAPVVVSRDREYPQEGPDSFGALLDTAVVHADSLPASSLAQDALHARGETEGEPAGSSATSPSAPPPSASASATTP
jgi:sec-independent protein translocase protein TatB